LVLDDDAPLRRRLAAYLRDHGCDVTEASSVAEARNLAGALSFDAALLDLQLPDGEALSLLREQVFGPATFIVIMTAFGSVEKAVEAMRTGAHDYLTKPFELRELPLILQRGRAQRLRERRVEHRQAEASRTQAGFFFSAGLAPLRQQLEAVLAADARIGSQLPPVLLEGETGTGKSALAHWIHQAGPRASAPFLAVNCAALPETLAEAELFGHERGAFTDAKQARMGLFEAADGGTLFLDEIGSLSLTIQAKLLTAIESGRVRRMGSTRETAIDARIIAATNQPLAERVRDGAFRDDLRHRLNLLVFSLPPLRERRDDIVPLAHHLLAAMAKRHRRPAMLLSNAAEARLRGAPWPGNVRELAHELERALIFEPGPHLELQALASAGPATAPSWRNPAWRLPEEGFSLDQLTDELIAEALRETGANVSAAARRLGVTRDFLRYRLQPPLNRSS
jgi:two-component system, NtrC family, response regulator AtoC